MDRVHNLSMDSRQIDLLPIGFMPSPALDMIENVGERRMQVTVSYIEKLPYYSQQKRTSDYLSSD